MRRLTPFIKVLVMVHYAKSGPQHFIMVIHTGEMRTVSQSFEM